MTNPHNQDRIAPIAGEPATAQPYKNIPPLTENHVNISDGFESGEQNTDKNKKSRKKFYAFLQVIIIVLALGLSTYSILLTESNDVNKGSLSNEGNEVLVRT